MESTGYQAASAAGNGGPVSMNERIRWPWSMSRMKEKESRPMDVVKALGASDPTRVTKLRLSFYLSSPFVVGRRLTWTTTTGIVGSWIACAPADRNVQRIRLAWSSYRSSRGGHSAIDIR